MTRKILLTGGYGDFLALEAGWTDEFRLSLTEIHWATSRSRELAALVDLLPNYDVEHFHLWSDWQDIPAFFSRDHLQSHLNTPLAPDIEDWSISVGFSKLSINVASSFLRHRLCEVNRELPENYVVVQPSTPFNRDEHRYTRDFTDRDWAGLIARLEREGRKGVILNSGERNAPSHPLLVDLTGETSLAESIEILKRARGYYGIDSALSVLAAKLFRAEDLWIRVRNPHCFQNLKRYYQPHPSYPFVVWSFEGGQPDPSFKLWLRDDQAGKAWRPIDDDVVPGDLSRGDRPNLKHGETRTFQYTSTDLSRGSLESIPDDVRIAWTRDGLASYAEELGYEVVEIIEGSITLSRPCAVVEESLTPEEIAEAWRKYREGA